MVGSQPAPEPAPEPAPDLRDKILVAATDLNVSLTAELKADNASEGGITLGAKNLYELIANAPGEDITLNASQRSSAARLSVSDARPLAVPTHARRKPGGARRNEGAGVEAQIGRGLRTLRVLGAGSGSVGHGAMRECLGYGAPHASHSPSRSRSISGMPRSSGIASV